MPNKVFRQQPANRLRADNLIKNKSDRFSSIFANNEFFQKSVVIIQGILKFWNGSSWISGKPMKYWSGSSWDIKPKKLWAGSAWVTLT